MLMKLWRVNVYKPGKPLYITETILVEKTRTFMPTLLLAESGLLIKK